jgi:hypothetical protein
MSDNQKTQHEQLIAAGWRYDAGDRPLQRAWRGDGWHRADV